MQDWKKKKKTKFKSVGECKSGKTPTQAWKKKNRVQKRWRMQVWKKKQSSKAQENVTVGILKKSDDGKDIIKKD